MGKVFLIDYDKCNGCKACQIVCKDEYCSQSWLPYSDAQPELGQFWLKVEDIERGRVPWVHVDYRVTLCNHCGENAPCIIAGGDAVYRREDGLVIIDPVKAKGNTALVDACPAGAIFYNEELGLAQKCTGCAHLLDNGWSEPRCVDACSTGALQYLEETEVDRARAEVLDAVREYGSRVFYYNTPKRFIIGTVFDSEADEVVIDATVSLFDDAGTKLAQTTTDDFGDFKFNQIEPSGYCVKIAIDGFQLMPLEADVEKADCVFDPIDISAQMPSEENE